MIGQVMTPGHYTWVFLFGRHVFKGLKNLPQDFSRGLMEDLVC